MELAVSFMFPGPNCEGPGNPIIDVYWVKRREPLRSMYAALYRA